MTAALTIAQPTSTALAAPRDLGPLIFSAEQEQMIRDTFASGASHDEFAMLMEIAKVRRLSPILKQIFFVKRWDSQKKREVWSCQISIDGLRAVAERTGRYDGQDEPAYEYANDGSVLKCTVKVYRKDVSRPFVGVAFFSEYAQTKRDGGLTQFWREKPHVMVAKCAEALAFRKGFPEDTSGLYVPEEMGADTGEVANDTTPERPREAQREASDGERHDDEVRAVQDFLEQIARIATKEDEKAVITAVLRNPFSDASRAELKRALESHRRKLAAAARNRCTNDAPSGEADTCSDERAQAAADRASEIAS